MIRQFVAMPLGEGYTVEEQITGAARHGGLQIVAYPMKRERYEELRKRGKLSRKRSKLFPLLGCFAANHIGMGLAPGGRMKQDIYDDPYGLDAWDQRHASRCFVSIVNSVQWMAITDEPPPTEPPTAQQYTQAGLPWFDYYGGDAEAIAGSEKLKAVASVGQVSKEKGNTLPENETLDVGRVIRLRKGRPRLVRECPAGEFGKP